MGGWVWIRVRRGVAGDSIDDDPMHLVLKMCPDVGGNCI